MEKYTTHLYAQAKGNVDLLAVKDILCFRGDIVFKAGALITVEAYVAMAKRRLQEPLEESVVLAEKETPETLYAHINSLVSADASFSCIEKTSARASVLNECCNSVKQYPELDVYLTLFKVVQPQLYEQSLRAAYLAYICAMACKFSQEDVGKAFLAGLLHDIGLLFIKRTILEKKGKLTADEWAKIRLHPIVAYKLLGEIESFPVVSRDAVLDHHECTDGSGYCRGKEGEEINDMALLVSILDDVTVIYMNKFKPINRTLFDVMPIIQMNTHGYPRHITAGVLQVIKQVEKSKIKPIDLKTLRELIEHTYQQQVYINRFVEVLEQIGESIRPEDKTKNIVKLQDIWKKVAYTITSSGIQDSSYVEWLVRSEGDRKRELYSEVENTRLMLQEVVFQINSYYNYVNSFMPDGLGNACDDYSIFVHVYSVTQTPVIPESLKE
jgi:hypothetical protein